MKIHQIPVEDTLCSLGSTAQGLSSPEALQRLREFGPNRVEEVAGASPVLRLLKEFVQFFSVILWIAAALAFVARMERPGPGHGADRLCHRRGDPGQRRVFLLAGISRRANPQRAPKAAAASRSTCCAMDRLLDWRWTSWCPAMSSCSSQARLCPRTVA